MRINANIINTAVKSIRSGVKRVDTPAVTCPMIKPPVKDFIINDAPLLRTPLSKSEVLNMKPSEFKSLIACRADITGEVAELVETSAELRLYDRINNILLEKHLPLDKRNEILKNFLNYSEPEAAYDAIPKLVKKGFDFEYLSRLPIDNLNKSIVEEVLVKHKHLIKSLADKKIKSDAEQKANLWVSMSKASEKKYEDYFKEALSEMETERVKLEKEIAGNILLYADKNNIKYLEEYFSLINADAPRLIHYWKPDTSKIITKWFKNVSSYHEPLDRIHRRKHDYNSICKIFGDAQINDVSQRLLEYKNFEKFKDIDLNNYNLLSNKEKKEFISCYIQALTPKDTLFNKNLLAEFSELSSKMNIYKSFDATSPETLTKSYQDILKKMMDMLPESEKTVIRTRIKYGDVRKEYRALNPIPPLVDDIQQLPFKEEIYNGKIYRIVEIKNDNTLGAATHRIPNGDSIINIEALEVTNPNELLCIGQNGGSRTINGADGNVYTLFTKPRLSNDLWVQACSDIDSGNHATKNIFNVNRSVLRGYCRYKRNHVWSSMDYVPELIKKELNLSQTEYTHRLNKLKECTTLNEIGKIDKEFELAIRKILKENNMYEGLIRPDIMGIKIPNKPLSEINENILSYAYRKNIPLVRIN